MDKVFADQLSKSNISNVVFVSQAGHDTFGTGDLVNPYKTIQRAIDLVSVNGTVVIDSGTYTENLTIVDGVNLVAVAKHTVVVVGKLTINNTTTNNGMSFDGINFTNSTDHTVNHISTISHNLSFYECNITQTGSGVYNAYNVLATTGDSQYKNTQISSQNSTGGSKAIYTGVGTAFGMTLFDCLIGVEDDADAVAIELNGNPFDCKNECHPKTPNPNALPFLAER